MTAAVSGTVLVKNRRNGLIWMEWDSNELFHLADVLL